MKVFKNVNEKNIDKFKNCVIKLIFNNIFITYIGFDEMTDEGNEWFLNLLRSTV